MSNKSNCLIGHLTDVRSDGMQAKLIAGEILRNSELSDNNEGFLVGQLGAYVSIRQNDIQILAMVNRNQELDGSINHESEDSRSDIEGSSSVQYLISLIPLGEIDGKGLFSRGIRHYPTTGAEVFTVGIDEIRKIFIKYQAYGFTVGSLSTNLDLDVGLDPTALFGRHFAVLGQSGTGKSWAVANLIQRATSVMPKAHIILIDPHGEYCWKNDNGEMHSAFDEDQVRYLDARELEIPYWLMTYAELIDLLIDRSDANASIQTAFLRETIYDLKKTAGKTLGLETISIDSPIYFSLQELLTQFKNANEQRSNFGKDKGILFGQFDEFLVKLQSRLNDVRYDFLLKPKHRVNSDSLSDLIRDFVGLGKPKRPITVIDLSSVPFDVRPSISAQIGRLAFEFNYWNPKNIEFPILLVCEEAHAYIPRDAGTQFEGTRKSMERIAKEGRKYGVGIGVVSQRPHELSETVLAQCGTFLCLRLTNPDDQRYVRDLVPESEGDLINILSALGRGEAMVMGEAAPLPTRIQLYKPNPTPNSNDVDYYQQWRSGPDDLDIDDIVDRWRRQRQ